LAGFRFDGSGRSFQTATVEHFKYKDVDGYESTARKAASAYIAKIPLVLARHIARVYWPLDDVREA
jgi:hypothetical protein